MLADRKAFLVGRAGRFDIDVIICHAVDHPDGSMLFPSRVCIRYQNIAQLENFQHFFDAPDVVVGVPPHFQLKSAIAFGSVS
jgi:hypothetical protein